MKLDLCAKCAMELQDCGYRVDKVSGKWTDKVVCEHCNKRNYGVTYLVEMEA